MLRELLDQGHYEEALRHVMRESMGLSETLLVTMQRDPLFWAGLVASAPVIVAETEALAGVASAASEPFHAIRQPTSAPPKRSPRRSPTHGLCGSPSRATRR
jgi:hypothetical protein